jgi:C4-dicarboxylate-specific signal transduction histidine kinase
LFVSSKRRETSAKRWIIPFAMVATLLPLIVLAAAALFAALAAYRTADEVRLRDTARALAAAVDAELGSYVAALRALSSSRLLDGPLDAATFEGRARLVAEDFGGWVVLLGPPPDHAVLAMSNRPPGATLPAQLPTANQRAIAGVLTDVFEHHRPGVSDLFTGSVVQQPILTIMIPVRPVGPSSLGLALSFEPEGLRALLRRQRLPAGTFAAVADSALRILAHTQDHAGTRIGAPAPEWVARAIDGQESALVVGPGWSGKHNVYAVERLTMAPGWTVTVAEPLAVQRAAAWRAVRWLLASAVALALALGGAAWASRREALRDVRREAAALRAGRAEIARLLGGLPAVVFLREVAADGSTRLLYRDGDLEGVTGWPASTFVGVDSLRRWVDLEAEDYHAFLARVVRDGAATIEYRMHQPDGAFRRLRAHARLLARRADGTAEVVGYILDVTAQRSAEARAMSASRLASLGELAAGLAHELKQPLQTISLAADLAQLALARSDPAEAERRLTRIIEQTGRAGAVIDHLRRFARGADEGVLVENVSLVAVVDGALNLTGSALRDASIEVEVALGDPAPVVRGQAVLLEQVLANLLLNARDALAARPPGTPRRICITAAPEPEGMVRLTVADTGGGIAPEVMARLFEPFVTTKGPDKGTGLGLSICHGLIQGMGGRIEAHNSAEGAVFSITLRAA